MLYSTDFFGRIQGTYSQKQDLLLLSINTIFKIWPIFPLNTTFKMFAVAIKCSNRSLPSFTKEASPG